MTSSLTQHFASPKHIEVHRGVNVELGGDEIDEALEKGHQGLHDLIARKASDPGHHWGPYGPRDWSGAGVHWTEDPVVAKHFSDPLARHHEQPVSRVGDYSSWSIPVVLHGKVHPDHVETDPEVLSDRRVQGHGYTHYDENYDEREVSVRKGAPVHLTGIEASLPKGNYRPHYERYSWNSKSDGSHLQHAWKTVHPGGTSVTAALTQHFTASEIGWDHVVQAQGDGMYPHHSEIEAYVQQRTGAHPADLRWSKETYPVSGAFPDPHGHRSPSRVSRAAQGYREHPEQMPPVIALDLYGQHEHLDGWHRLGGAEQAGLSEVPAYVGRMKDDAVSKQATRLSLEDYISVAEEAMERGGHHGRHWDLPSPRDYPEKSEDPGYKKANQPVNDFVQGVLSGAGYQHGSSHRVYAHPYALDSSGGGQAMVSEMGSIITRHQTTDLTLLHECAHVLNRSQEGEGHDKKFADTLHGLYHQHLGPEAADTFHGIVSNHPDYGQQKQAAKADQGDPMRAAKHWAEEYLLSPVAHPEVSSLIRQFPPSHASPKMYSRMMTNVAHHHAMEWFKAGDDDEFHENTHHLTQNYLDVHNALNGIPKQAARPRPRHFKPEPPPEGQHAIFRGLYLGRDPKPEHIEAWHAHPQWMKDTLKPPAPIPVHDDQALLGRVKSIDHAKRKVEHEQWRAERTAEGKPDPGEYEDLVQKWPMFGRHWTANHSLAKQFALDPQHGHYRVPRIGGTQRLHGLVLEAHSSTEPEHDDIGSEYGETEVKFPHRSQITRVRVHLHSMDPTEAKWPRPDTYVRSFEMPVHQWKNASLTKQADHVGDLYHGTDGESAKSILRNGLHPQSYLTSDPGYAKDHAEFGSSGCQEWFDWHGHEDEDAFGPEDCPHEDHLPGVVLKIKRLRGEGSEGEDISDYRHHNGQGGSDWEKDKSSLFVNHRTVPPEDIEVHHVVGEGMDRAYGRDSRQMFKQASITAAKDDIESLFDLIGGNRPSPKPEPTEAEKAAQEAEFEQRRKDHEEWQAKRPGLNPGENIDAHPMRKDYPHAEWVPIAVAQRFRDHFGDQHHGSQQVVDGIAEQLKAGRGMTDPLMLLHHNERGVAHLGEGNHRLRAAEQAGWTHVPMRVVRMYDGEAEEHGASFRKRIPQEWRGTHAGRTPEMAKPSQVLHPDLFGHRKQASAGQWERDEDGNAVAWKQDHPTLLQDALHAWVGWPTDMARHIHEISTGHPPKEGTSGTYKIDRARAEALHTELQASPPIPRRLYRGVRHYQSPDSGLHPHMPTTWSESKKVAAMFGTVHTLEPGQARGIKMADHISSGLDSSERQWLLVAHPEDSQ